MSAALTIGAALLIVFIGALVAEHLEERREWRDGGCPECRAADKPHLHLPTKRDDWDELRP